MLRSRVTGRTTKTASPALSPSAILLMGLGASLLALVPVRRWGAWVAIAAGPLLALGALIFIDVEATGYFLDESARMPATAASLVAAVLVIGALALGRLGPGAERWKAAADPVELPRTR